MIIISQEKKSLEKNLKLKRESDVSKKRIDNQKNFDNVGKYRNSLYETKKI